MDGYKSSAINRRAFLKLGSMTAGAMLLQQMPLQVLADEWIKLTILHTNDWHSRIEAFPMDGSKNQGLGGAAARAEIIKRIRTEEKHVLLLDAGDLVQGTPYFNFFGGELEIKLMNQMQYDACTIGNHDFDNGLDGLGKMIGQASFPFINCNYDLSETDLHKQVIRHKVFSFEGVKVGILGVGIDGAGLIPDHLFGKTRYLHAVNQANQEALFLKQEMKCDMVICLSHLGYQYADKKILSDEILAIQSENIDLIIGGHTHTFLPHPVAYKNKLDKQILINQVGWAGLQIGRLDYFFHRSGRKIFSQANTVKIDKKSI